MHHHVLIFLDYHMHNQFLHNLDDNHLNLWTNDFLSFLCYI
ncbi:unnamed protein product [Schistosoma curassoni]|uniref:Uncharacterized protein n=1 Tax=Schistosoma curassoni TaxID=6186 RepID=A0A183KFW0_9TREM|nr:unnamed protein product [Schistosoma curassoni]